MMAAARRAWTIAKKDIRIYYLRGPVIIFGVLFPAFLFMAFAWGRGLPARDLVPGLIAMALFFTSSATTPAVMPFETRTRTLERLLVAPITVPTLICGDVLAAVLFGVVFSLLPTAFAVGIIGAPLNHPAFLIAGILLSALCFAILGSLFSLPPTDNPSSIMTISNLVRLPLIFISGIFVPIAHMASWMQPIALLSPLTYTTEIIRAAFGQTVVVSPWLCLVVLAGFTVVLWVITITAHRRNMPKRLVG